MRCSWALVFVSLVACEPAARLAPLGEQPQVLHDLAVCEIDGAQLRADLVRPALAKHLRRGILLVHGGGWSTGSRSDYEPLMRGLGSAGFTALAVDYRLSPAVQHPQQVHDLKCALRWLRGHAEELDVDADKLAVIGGSAGAHLAAFLAYTPDDSRYEGRGQPRTGGSRLAAAVLHGCPSDLTAYDSFSPEQQGAVRALLGTQVPTRSQLRAASPLGLVRRDSVPTLILHGRSDTVVPPEQAYLLDATLTSLGVSHRLVMISGAGHADFGPDPDAVGRELLSFLTQALQ